MKNKYQIITCEKNGVKTHACEELVPNPYTCETLVLNYHSCEELVLYRSRQICEEMKSSAKCSRFGEYYECEEYTCMQNKI